mmetsp:Transcript_45664/g.99240  ORF Transcript_45664/g.99240 Transcript_45664/m.99240 type:complete len:334 (+) Transcript_45664:66-1067(+)
MLGMQKLLLALLTSQLFSSALPSESLCLLQRQSRFHRNSNGGVWSADQYTALGSSVDGVIPVVASTLGYQGSGTEIISHVLRLHPDVVRKSCSESHYSASPEVESQWTSPASPEVSRRLFEGCLNSTPTSAGQVLLDFASTYSTTASISNLKANLQGLGAKQAAFRFIAVLTEPASRAVSAVSFMRRMGDYSNFTDSQLDEMLYEKLLERQRTGEEHRLIADGEYVTLIRSWMQAFPSESLLVLNGEHMSELKTWSRIYHHLGLREPDSESIHKMLWTASSSHRMPQLQVHRGILESHREPYLASPWLIQKLQDYYEEYNSELWQTLAASPWW